MADWIDIGV